jgi:hypothetical protein
MAPPGVIRPMPLPVPFMRTSVNQTFPSGPTVIENGLLFDGGIENSVTV